MAGQVRQRFVFRGVIQGVGFRPAVYRCAVELGLTGFVQNLRSEVAAEVQGPSAAVARFQEAACAPAAGRGTGRRGERDAMPLHSDKGFRIAESESTPYRFPPIPPDLALCGACRRELLDPRDRRYLFPFISCTQCGPRYTIVEDTPFDRDTTSMRDFPLCPECRREYEDPADRRFHAQASSCPACGPRLTLRDASGAAVAGDPVLNAIDALAAGLVVALQGIGGFHIAADPDSEPALLRLRRDKERARKPLALMVRDADAAARLCALDAACRAELASPARPDPHPAGPGPAALPPRLGTRRRWA